LVGEENYNLGGAELYSKKKIKYYSNGNEEIKEWNKSGGSKVTKITCEFHGQVKSIKEIKYYDSGVFQVKSVFKNDSHGNMIERADYVLDFSAGFKLKYLTDYQYEYYE
jgi:hypothetical protein